MVWIPLIFRMLTISGSPEPTSESRAVEFLIREVPRWSAENRCFSCHNNGDAARALFAARRLSLPVTDASVRETLEWLRSPDRWEQNGGEGAFSDKRLARLQFASALAAAIEADLIHERGPLVHAAQLVAGDQEPDGSWPSDASGHVGSPATYGRVLATYQARETLRAADAKAFAPAIRNADGWLRRVQPRNILDAAAILLATERDPEAPETQRHEAIELIRKAQSTEGGWGPYVTAPPEPFDTAVVLLALRQFVSQPSFRSMLDRGRHYLVRTQLPDGSWPETTRPPGAESYAQRVSTTGWATLALLGTARK